MNEKLYPQQPPHPELPSDHSYNGVMNKLMSSRIAAALAATAIACTPTKESGRPEHDAPSTKESAEDGHEKRVERVVPTTETGLVHYIEKKDEEEFLKKHENGKFTEEERAERLEKLPNGELVFRDVGLTFYKVQKGDSIARIKARLVKYPEFNYLNDQRQKLQSFNIKDSHLRAGMWLPIPLKNKERHLSEEDFMIYAENAINDLENDKKYSAMIKKILARPGMDRKHLILSMLAVAKRESGGSPLGLNEFHRWEGDNGHGEFSFSMLHILMRGPGFSARCNLGLTEGQTYHPENAVKLFLAFVREKGREPAKDIDVSKFFPFTKARLEDFAAFYNGKKWRVKNKSYPVEIFYHYNNALKKYADN